MTVASVYPLYVAKVERKGRTKAELDQVIEWLTGFDDAELAAISRRGRPSGLLRPGASQPARLAHHGGDLRGTGRGHRGPADAAHPLPRQAGGRAGQGQADGEGPARGDRSRCETRNWSARRRSACSRGRRDARCRVHAIRVPDPRSARRPGRFAAPGRRGWRSSVASRSPSPRSACCASPRRSPVRAWSGVREALSYGPPPPQGGHFGMDALEHGRGGRRLADGQRLVARARARARGCRSWCGSRAAAT